MPSPLEVASFARQIYAPQLSRWWAGTARRDPLARLHLAAGRADPHRFLEQMRARGPLLPTRLGHWSSTSYPVCHQVLRSRSFGVQDLDQTAKDEVDLSFLMLDPPDHTRLRRIAAPAFGPRAVDGYAATVEKTVQRLLDDAERASAADGRFDLVDALAAPLPIAVITELLGIPDAETERFTRYGAALGGALDGIRSLRHARELLQANLELERLFSELVERRRTAPQDDLLSRLAVLPEDRLEPGEVVPLCTLLLIAGFETTVNLVSNAVRALLDHPDQWRALVEEPTLVPAAVEEVLRWDPPVRETARVAHEDVELADRTVRRGQWVVTLLAAANRDPDVFEDPARFDVRRSVSGSGSVEHLAFSGGMHYCLGAPLARLEVQGALRAQLERMPGLQPAGPVRMRPTSTIRGPLHLPVRRGLDRRPA